MKKYLFTAIFVVWIAAAFLVRLVGLERSPASVGFDEASLGYNAYSILLTGKDEYGTSFPLSLRSFNDFKPALYAYIAIPFVKFIGLNQTSTRLPSAVFGTLSLIFLFLIFKKISGKSPLLALIIVIFISFLPWRIHFSRVAFEANVSMAFFTIVIWSLLNFNKNVYYKISTIFFSGLAIYSYHAARLTIPILLFLIIADSLNFRLNKIFRRPFGFIKDFWPLWCVLILYIPLFWEFRASFILTRLGQTNIFTHYYPFTPKELISTPIVWFNLLGNPLYYFGGYLTGHVFSYFSPQNLSLLIYPGVIKSAQAIAGMGMVGTFGGILFILGLTRIKELVLDKTKRIILYSIFSGIAPAAITWEWFYPLRSINIYPAIDIIIGLGLLSIIAFVLKQKAAVKYILTLFLLSLATTTSLYTLLNELNYGTWETGGEFQPGGFKEGVPLLKSLAEDYKTVYLDSNQGQSYEIFWFYLSYPPSEIQKLASLRNIPGQEGPSTLNFGKFVYKKFSWPSDKFNNDFVFWTTSEVKETEINSVKGAKLYKIINPSGYWVASIITKE